MAWPCIGPSSRVRRISRSSVPCSNSMRFVCSLVDILGDDIALPLEFQGGITSTTFPLKLFGRVHGLANVVAGDSTRRSTGLCLLGTDNALRFRPCRYLPVSNCRGRLAPPPLWQSGTRSTGFAGVAAYSLRFATHAPSERPSTRILPLP